MTTLYQLDTACLCRISKVCCNSKIREERPIDIGKELRKMRKSAGMSQEDVALDLHMPISTISRIETGKYHARAVDAIRWANTTQSQEVVAAMILGIDIGVLQQALEVVATTSIPGLIFGLFL